MTSDKNYGKHKPSLSQALSTLMQILESNSKKRLKWSRELKRIQSWPIFWPHYPGQPAALRPTVLLLLCKWVLPHTVLLNIVWYSNLICWNLISHSNTPKQPSYIHTHTHTHSLSHYAEHNVCETQAESKKGNRQIQNIFIADNEEEVNHATLNEDFFLTIYL